MGTWSTVKRITVAAAGVMCTVPASGQTLFDAGIAAAASQSGVDVEVRLDYGMLLLRPGSSRNEMSGRTCGP